MILTGAIPIYVNPEVDKRLGISLGMSIDQVKQAIIDNPDAKAILVNNPTYYGICSNLKEIVRLAHEHNMLALVDEAHGTLSILDVIYQCQQWKQERIWQVLVCINQVVV